MGRCIMVPPAGCGCSGDEVIKDVDVDADAMSKPRKIILFEANEVPDQIYRHYAAERPESALAQALPVCRRYETQASDKPLSPWVTWPTVHRGVGHQVHGLQHFGQALNELERKYPPIWKLLLDGGVKTGVFAPLHSWPMPEDHERYEFYVPDTFAQTTATHPASLEPFQAFNLSMARQSPRNVSRNIDAGLLAKFLLRAPFLGLKTSTLVAAARQLLDERKQKWKSNRRRTYQSVFAYDLFLAQLKQRKPEFSNYFTNHVASAMHRYWAAVFPEEFENLELDDAWQARYSAEIIFAMDWLDSFFGCLVQFVDANPDFLIVTASSMGQGASDGRRFETQLYLRKPELLLARAGLSEDEWERRPSMDPSISIVVNSARTDDLAAFLGRVRIGDKPLRFHIQEQGFFNLSFGESNLDPEASPLLIDGQREVYEELGFENTKVEDEAGSTGFHIPEGTLFIYDPADKSPKGNQGRLSTTEIAPALLDHFGVSVPSYMPAAGALRFS